MGQETNSDTSGIYIDPHDRLSHGGRVAALPPGEPSDASLAQHWFARTLEVLTVEDKHLSENSSDFPDTTTRAQGRLVAIYGTCRRTKTKTHRDSCARGAIAHRKPGCHPRCEVTRASLVNVICLLESRVPTSTFSCFFVDHFVYLDVRLRQFRDIDGYQGHPHVVGHQRVIATTSTDFRVWQNCQLYAPCFWS